MNVAIRFQGRVRASFFFMPVIFVTFDIELLNT